MRTYTLLLCFLLLQSCAIINAPVQLFSSRQPLTETVISGSGSDKILLLSISGDISNQGKHSLMGGEGRPGGTVSQVTEALNKAAEDPAVKAIVLRINSQGGTVTASDIIYNEIKQFKAKTKIPVVACLLDYATSGGYYAAVAADSIFAHPTTITGSIGVLFIKMNLQGLMQKLGIGKDMITGGTMKGASYPFAPFTGEERKVVQKIIDHLHQRFIQIVAENRPLSLEETKKVADGRVYHAEDALALKLIDHIGYLPDAITAAQNLAGLNEAKLVSYHQPDSYKSDIYAQQSGMPTMSLLNLDFGAFAQYGSAAFLYRWAPPAP